MQLFNIFVILQRLIWCFINPLRIIIIIVNNQIHYDINGHWQDLWMTLQFIIWHFSLLKQLADNQMICLLVVCQSTDNLSDEFFLLRV